MCCTNCFQRQKLGHQMALLTIFFGFGLLFFSAIASIVAIWWAGEAVKSDSEDVLLEQAISNATVIIRDQSDLFGSQLLNTIYGVMGLMTYSYQDTFRFDGYNMAPLTSYMNFGIGSLKPPLTLDPRRQQPVSRGASGYSFPGKFPADVGSFTPQMNRDLEATSHSDSFTIPTYPHYPTVGSYLGLEADGLFRHYPGVDTELTDPTRNYDPRTRPWYTQAEADLGNIQFTAPYRDFFTRLWTITASLSVQSLEDASILYGVGGIDILIETLNEQIKEITLVDTGKLSIIQSDGTVVADKEWDLTDASLDSPLTYSQLNNPPISSTLWGQIVAQAEGATNNTEYELSDGSIYQVVYHTPTGFDSQYRFVAFIPIEELEAQIEPVIDELEKTQQSSFLIIIVIFLVVVIALSILLVIASHYFTRHFHQITAASDQVVQQLGGKMGEGMEQLPTSQLAPIQALTTAFNDTLTKLHQEQQEAIEANIQHDLSHQLPEFGLPTSAHLPPTPATQEYKM